MQFTELLSVIADQLAIGYVLSALPLFACFFLLGKRREQLKHFVAISNSLLLFAALVYLLHYLLTRQEFAQQMQDEWGSFTTINRYFGPYWFSYWGGILLRGILPLMLLLPKVRNSVWSLLLFCPLVLLSFFTALIYIFSERDYLPGSVISWKFDAYELLVGTALYVVIYAILLFIIYFAKSFFEKRKMQ